MNGVDFQNPSISRRDAESAEKRPWAVIRDCGTDGFGYTVVTVEIAIGIDIGHGVSILIPIRIAIRIFPIGPHRPSAVHMGTLRLRKAGRDLMIVAGGGQPVQWRVPRQTEGGL
jgi:hypothetical protein